MAISIPVSAVADDRSFKQISDRYEKWGNDTGKKIGDGLAKGIDDPKVEKAFSKVGDMMSKVRAEEAKLQDLRDKGASNSRIVAQTEALSRARSAETRATNDAIRAYDGMSASTSRLSGLTSSLSSALAGTRFGALAGDVQNLTSKFGGMELAAGGAVAGVAAIADTAAVAGKALYDLGSMWDSVGDKIAMRTGKFDGDLQAITDSVKRVAADTAAPIEKIGDISGQVVQSLGLTGPALDEMTRTLTNLDAQAGNPVGVRELAKVYNLFGIEAKDQVKTLDQLFNVSQKTGIPMQELVTNLTQAGVAAKQFGFTAGQTAGLLSTFEQAGLDGSKTTGALTFAFKQFSKEGKEAGPALAEVVKRIQDLADAHRDDEAAALATATFGGKNYLAMLEAIKDHKVDIDSITESWEQNGTSIAEATEKTADLEQAWTKLSNQLKNAAAPQAEVMFTMMNQQIERLIGGAQRAKDILEDLFGTVKAPDLNDVTVTGGNGPHGGYGDLNRGAGGGGPAGNRAGDGTGRGLTGLGDGGFSFPGPTSSSSGSSSKPNIPSGQYSLDGIPLGQFPGEVNPGLPGRAIEQHTGPGGYEVDPQKVFDAQTGVMSANKSVEEARRRILEIQADNNHTEQELQSAKDALVLADRNNLKAQQDLIDAQIGTWKNAEKQTKELTSGMNQLSSGLDADLGISKGLAGMADNLVRFLGNLATAPLQAQLNAQSAAQGGIGVTGSGLMGYLGASGAFGPQFQIAGYDANGKPISAAQAQSSGASGGRGGSRGGYPGDAALLANVPAGSYETPSSSPVWDLNKGLADCSSSVEDLVNIMDGRPTGGRSMATGNAGQWLTSRGFMPGMGGPGDFRVGFRNGGAAGGHMQATLPGGTPFNWGSDSSAANRGIGGTGAFDPSFTDHYYRPTGGGAAPGGGGQYAPATPEQLVQQGLLTPTLYDEGGILPPGTTVVQNNTGGNEHVVKPASSPGPGNMGGIGSAAKGPGGPGTSTGQQGATQIGGAEPHAQNGGSAGAGGGLMGLATSAASMAADAFAPGAGQAVQVGSQVLQRSIKLGGQLTGLGVQGLMETFLPTGGSQIANDNWLTRIGGGFAGASAQLPNLAGKNPGGDPPPQAPTQPMPMPAAPGPQKGGGDQRPINVTLNGVGDVNDTSLNHFTGDLSRAVNMPGWAR